MQPQNSASGRWALPRGRGKEEGGEMATAPFPTIHKEERISKLHLPKTGLCFLSYYLYDSQASLY